MVQTSKLVYLTILRVLKSLNNKFNVLSYGNRPLRQLQLFTTRKTCCNLIFLAILGHFPSLKYIIWINNHRYILQNYQWSILSASSTFPQFWTNFLFIVMDNWHLRVTCSRKQLHCVQHQISVNYVSYSRTVIIWSLIVNTNFECLTRHSEWNWIWNTFVISL